MEAQVGGLHFLHARAQEQKLPIVMAEDIGCEQLVVHGLSLVCELGVAPEYTDSTEADEARLEAHRVMKVL